MKKFITLVVTILMATSLTCSVSALSWNGYNSYGESLAECDDIVADARNTVYAYLCDNTELNRAAICGILGNIWAESCFETEETYGSYHGLCQWGYERWTACQTFCENNGYSSDSALGQAAWLVYELKNNYTSTYQKLLNVTNSEDGVYNAEHIFRINFEGCGEQAALRRQTAAINYWNVLPVYNSTSGVVTETTTRTTTQKTKQTTTVAPATTKTTSVVVTTTIPEETVEAEDIDNIVVGSAEENTTKPTTTTTVTTTVVKTPKTENKSVFKKIGNKIKNFFINIGNKVRALFRK